MLDPNRLLLIIAWVSPAIVLLRTWRRAALNRGWRFASYTVLIVTAIACVFAPHIAGYLGGGAWLALLFLPAVGLRKAGEFAAEERFTTARRMVGALQFLHPMRSVREEATLLRALELAQTGNPPRALQLLEKLAPNETRAGRRARAESFRVRDDWSGLAAWCRLNIPRIGLGEDPALLPLYLRSLGEIGLRDELILQFAGRASPLLASPLHQAIYSSALLLVLAFSGRTKALREFWKTNLPGMHRDARDFWSATAEIHAGDSTGWERLLRLRDATSNALIRSDAAQRLAFRDRQPTLPLSRPSEETVRRFERHQQRNRGWLLAPPVSRITPTVAVFIALNVFMFLVETALGGSTNPITLHRLGALEPSTVLLAHQYWRLIACLFLHYGVLHLLFNLYALYILGPTLEAAIGGVRFAVAYLLSGIGSSIGVVLLWRIGWTQADSLVGASGCVMGIVGAWAGLLLRHRHTSMARRRLTSVGVIVAMQTAFDFYTPQVSMAAHLSGVVAGLFVGLALAPKSEM